MRNRNDLPARSRRSMAEAGTSAATPMEIDGDIALPVAPPQQQPPPPHIFLYDTDLKSTLEARAVRLHSWEKKELAKVARDNYRIVQQGQYMDEFSNMHSIDLAADAVNSSHRAPQGGGRPLGVRHARTRLAVVRMDTATCTRAMHDLREPAAALNFANQNHPGGGYLNGARAQEEDLCRLMPPLYSSLMAHRYPLKDDQALYTRTWICRTAGNYHLVGPPVPAHVITAAMPDLHSYARRKLKPRSEQWRQTVTVRVRAVLHAARMEGCSALVLGAFGCGAFGNPPQDVAAVFARCLASAEFRGAFATVVFAIAEFRASDEGNLAAFADAMAGLCRDAGG